MKTTFAFFAAFFLLKSISYAQEIRIAPVVGASFTLGMSSSTLKNETKENLNELREDNPGVNYNSTVTPISGFLFGATVDYSLSESLTVESGLLFHLRGRRQNISSKGTDSFGDKVDVKGSYTHHISYIELPFWVNYKFGQSGFKLTGGPSLGFAVSAKEKFKIKGTDGTLSDSEKAPIGSDPYHNTVKPLDISLNLGVGKEFELQNNPLELTLFIQPSLTAWNSSSKLGPDYWYRHFSTGIRAAYYFSVR